MKLLARLALAVWVVGACSPSKQGDNATVASVALARRLPTGARLEPEGTLITTAAMGLGLLPSPDHARATLVVSGFPLQGVQTIDLGGRRVTQTLSLGAAFLGAAYSRDGHTMFVSGGDNDVVYRFRVVGDSLALSDSIMLAPHARQTRFPAGMALSPNGRTLYVAENLADSLAAIDALTGRVIAHYPAGRYPYGVVATDTRVFVSDWASGTGDIVAFNRRADGSLTRAGIAHAGRHPSTMLLSPDGSRLFATSAQDDRVAVIDADALLTLTMLEDPAPSSPNEGTTPNALALSPDGTRLYVAEADANAVAVFDLSRVSSGTSFARGDDRMAGRIPTAWYPCALAMIGDTLLVATAKGLGTQPVPNGPDNGLVIHDSSLFVIGQLRGALEIIPTTNLDGQLAAMTSRVTRLNDWGARVPATSHPPIQHVVYILKENRTYDQVLGDLPQADGDTSLVFFGRSVTPNHHALAERFGIYDRFFTNAEISSQGHAWSNAAYSGDFDEKTTPSVKLKKWKHYDYEGLNRDSLTNDDVNEPINGYLWDAARRAGISFRNYGHFAHQLQGTAWQQSKPYLRTHSNLAYPGFDLTITDRQRAALWLDDFRADVINGTFPALEMIQLPSDHTEALKAGKRTPRAYLADNDLALGYLVDAISHSRYWKNTAIIVMEDDAQNGPDHVDSHRSMMFVISPYTGSGVIHRFVNTTDVIATIEELLGLDPLSSFDAHGRPLREIWNATPNLRPYTALVPETPLDEMNPSRTALARRSAAMNFSDADEVDDDLFNRVLWAGIKGSAPYPGEKKASVLAQGGVGGKLW